MDAKHGPLSQPLFGVLCDSLEDRRKRVQRLESERAAEVAPGDSWEFDDVLEGARRELKEAIAEGRAQELPLNKRAQELTGYGRSL